MPKQKGLLSKKLFFSHGNGLGIKMLAKQEKTKHDLTCKRIQIDVSK